MSSSAKLTATRALSLLASVFIFSSAVSAQDAAKAGEPCSGILCDFIDGTLAGRGVDARPAGQTTALKTGLLGHLLPSGAPDSSAAGPAAPSAPAAATAPEGEFHGGGLVNMLRGASEERCTGGLCDLYYGGSPAPPATAAPQGTPQPAETAAAATVTEPPPPDPVEPRPQPRCVVTAQDPWHCYRK